MQVADSSQPHAEETRKRKRGEVRGDGMVFLKYKHGKEKWGTLEELAELRRKTAEKAKRLRAADPEKARERSRANHAKHKEKEREYYRLNRERILESNKRWSSANKERHRALINGWNASNPEKMREYARKAKSSESWKVYVRAYTKKRRRDVPKVAMSERIRARIKSALRGNGYGKSKLSREVLGCSWDDFTKHLESKFLSGMTWSNINKWHIDHFIPVSAARDVDEVYMLNHFSNLRPLWGIDNLKKNAKLPENFVDVWNELCQKTGNELKMR